MKNKEEKLYEVRFGWGDSRNPDDRKNNLNVPHTNSITPWINYMGKWWMLNKDEYITVKSLFSDCKTKQEQKILWNMLIESNIIYNEDNK